MLWWVAAAVCAYFVKGLCGFGNTLVFTTVLAFGHDNVNISPVDLLLGYPSNVYFAWRERKHINWRICLPLIALILLGNIPGMLFLKNADTRLIKIIFGIVTMLIGADMLLRKGGEGKQSKWMLGAIGLLSGVLCGLYGVGALISAYISRVTKDTHAFKGNMCMVFTAENTFRLIVYACLGILTGDVALRALVLALPMVAAFFLGIGAGKRLDEAKAKRLVILMLIFSGAALVVNSL